ncbi:MAG: hypothetical protein ACFFA4_09560 [Promethearchaeota archaeon]
MVNFLLLLEEITIYSKNDIDQGKTPPNVYMICSCIREAFCLSYAIRKDNFLFLYFQREHILTKFDGRTIRYLGPDERSQAILLNKAVTKIYETFDIVNNRWIESTPGISSKKFANDLEFIEFFKSISYGKNYFIMDLPQDKHENIKLLNLDKNFIPIDHSDFFIIPTSNIQKNHKTIIEMLKKIKNINILSLPMIKSIEDKILYINFRKDQQSIS